MSTELFPECSKFCNSSNAKCPCDSVLQTCHPDVNLCVKKVWPHCHPGQSCDGQDQICDYDFDLESYRCLPECVSAKNVILNRKVNGPGYLGKLRLVWFIEKLCPIAF